MKLPDDLNMESYERADVEAALAIACLYDANKIQACLEQAETESKPGRERGNCFECKNAQMIEHNDECGNVDFRAVQKCDAVSSTDEVTEVVRQGLGCKKFRWKVKNCGNCITFWIMEGKENCKHCREVEPKIWEKNKDINQNDYCEKWQEHQSLRYIYLELQDALRGMDFSGMTYTEARLRFSSARLALLHESGRYEEFLRRGLITPDGIPIPAIPRPRIIEDPGLAENEVHIISDDRRYRFELNAGETLENIPINIDEVDFSDDHRKSTTTDKEAK